MPHSTSSTQTLRVGETCAPFRIAEGLRVRTERVASGGGFRLDATLEDGIQPIDISWLPSCAEALRISADIRDYVLVDVPIVRLDIPNRNMDAFPFEEATRWKVPHGRITYRTFVGKPTCLNHQNKVAQNPDLAKGVIFDAQLDASAKVIRILAGFDRTKDKALAESILRRQRTGFSMGALVGVAKCSVPGCGKQGSRSYCEHTQATNKGRIYSGVIAYEQCYDVNWIEASSVDDPADVRAHGRQVW
jgi:hypothetical protein